MAAPSMMVTVLDRVNPRIRCPSHALGPVRVGGNFSSQPVGFGHDRLHLLERELRGIGIVALGHHAARGADLDDVCAILDDHATLVLDILNYVGGSLALDNIQ